MVNTHTEKTKDSKINAFANRLPLKQREGTFQLQDHRTEAITQRKIQTIINNSPQVSQLRSYQTIANLYTAKKETSNKITAPQSLNNTVIQGEFISVIGEEVPAGSTTLQDGAETLMGIYGEEAYYTEEQINSGDFKTPKIDETIYLIAHGDNPAVSMTTEAALGEKNGVQVKNIVKKILSKFTQENKEEQFAGKIILEGCHTAEPVIDETQKAKKGSMLYDFQQAMLNDNFFGKNMAPEASIGGYLGQAFSSNDTETGYGTANTEHPLTKKFQNQRGIAGTKQGDGSISYDENESFLESRWKKQLDFGVPNKETKGKKTGKQKRN